MILMHFCSGQTSSVSSREETVSNVITITSGVTASQSQSHTPTVEKISPTASSSNFRSRGYKTASPRLSTAAQGGSSAVGSVSPSPLSRSSGGRTSVIRRPKLSSSASASVDDDTDTRATDEIEYQSVTRTLLRTFMTTYTYFTTLFNGEDTSIKSRTEVITNVVPYVTKTLAPIVPSSIPVETVEPSAFSTGFKMSLNKEKKEKETTFYTTYTYLSTIFKGRTSSIKTSKQTYTNIVAGEVTLRSGYLEAAAIAPTSITGRSAGRQSKASKTVKLNSIENDIEDEVTTIQPINSGSEYELEGSEDVGVTTNVPHNYESENEDDNNVEKTPLLKTLYTTFTFYTTYYKGGSSTVSSRLETKSQLVTDTAGLLEEDDVTVTEKAPLLSTIDPTYPVTYFTT